MDSILELCYGVGVGYDYNYYKAFENSVIYREGYEAGYDAEGENHYVEGSVEWALWDAGYKDGAWDC